VSGQTFSMLGGSVGNQYNHDLELNFSNTYRVQPHCIYRC